MLKQKKTLILLTAVLVVWGIIGLQIYGYLNPDEEKLQEISTEQFNLVAKKQKETYQVKIHERDPFLGKLLIKQKKVRKTIVKKEPIIFPNILYNGIIESNKKRAFIITINGQQKEVRKGQTSNEVTLINGSAKEVLLRYKGKKQVFKIKH